MNAQVIGKNLARLRTAKGLTQQALADEAGISVPGYRNFENGKLCPKINILNTLGEIFGIGIEELIQERNLLSNVRFRALKKLHTREQILLDFGKKLEGYREVESLLGEKKSKFKPKARKAMDLAGEIRRELKLGDKAPVVNICRSLEGLGIKVINLKILSEWFFGLAVDNSEFGPAIAVNTWDRIPVERWIFSAAHEAGHIFLHQDSFKSGEEEENDKEEKEANEFASFFLMPKEAFEEEWQQSYGLLLIDRVFKLKRLFRVSYATVLYRIQNQFKNVWKIFQGQYKKRFNRSLSRKEEPVEASPTINRAGEEPKRLDDIDFSEDRLQKLTRRALDQELVTRDRAAEILGLSIDQMTDLIQQWNHEERPS